MELTATFELSALRNRIREAETLREKATADLATFNEQIRTIKVNRARRIDHNQVREYDAKRKQLENEVARSKVNAGEAWDIYAQASCLNLATLVQTRLPRELRDEIYKQIWGKDQFDPCTCERSLHCKHWKRAPHYVKANYVGVATSQEIVEFLESDHFKSVTVCEVRHLAEILEQDRFRVGKPAMHYIRRMELFLNPYDYTNPNSPGPSEIPCLQDLRRLQLQLLPLLEMPGGHGFTLTIVVKGSQYGVYVNLLEGILEVIRPTYTNLTKEGASVIIEYVVTIEYALRIEQFSLHEFYTAPDLWGLRVEEELKKLGRKSPKGKIFYPRAGLRPL